MATSIYDGITAYPLGHTVFHLAEEEHRGGLYCYTTVRKCHRNFRDLSMLLYGKSAIRHARRILTVNEALNVLYLMYRYIYLLQIEECLARGESTFPKSSAPPDPCPLHPFYTAA